jgi:predicted Zn-dependent protease
VIRLQETRKKIRASVDTGQTIAVRLLADEALEVARAGYPEEGLVLVEELLASNPKFSTAWNTKGLIHYKRAEYQQALECYEKASLLEPSSMVIRGNCGTALMCLKRHQEAVLVMREALSKDSSLTYLHSWLVDAFQALGNIDEMTKELERWHAHAQLQTIRREDDVSAWEELRRVATRLGRYTEADEANEKIRQLSCSQNLIWSEE